MSMIFYRGKPAHRGSFDQTQDKETVYDYEANNEYQS